MSASDSCYVSRWLSGLPGNPALPSPPVSPSISLSPASSPSLLPLNTLRPWRRKRTCVSVQDYTPPLSSRTAVMDSNRDSKHGSLTISDVPTTPSSKKRRLDPEATPKPVLPSDSASQVSKSSDSVSTRSEFSPSRTSSPTKQFIRLQISNPLNIHFSAFDTDTLPTDLQDIRRLFYLYGSNQRMIPYRDKVLEESAPELAKNSLLPITDATFYNETEPHRYGPTPTTDEVSAIQANSNYCEAEQASEAIWNVEVHHQILCTALRQDRKSIRAGLVNFAYCTSAAIHSHLYQGSKRAQSKMVDFCLYIDSDVLGRYDPAAEAALRLLRAKSRSSAVNHTDFGILSKHPIALAIESKRQDGSFNMATLQVGTWQAAHWKFLKNLLTENGLDLGTLEYLPGLIVQGSEWFFVASTRKDDATTLWTKQLIGCTSTALGVYRVIRAIQCLAAWCADIYWPWFRANVLDLDGKEADLSSSG